MKLRNKKTGEIVEISGVGLVWNRYGMPFDLGRYKSLTELNEEWEDYKPAEPYIENEKTREIVRAWAECCHAQVINHYLCDGCSCFVFTDEKGNDCCLDFTFRIDNLESNVDYTIAEL